MTFAEAKARSDYKFFHHITEELNELKNKSFKDWDDYERENGVFKISLAALEIGSVDIELNVTSYSKVNEDGYINLPIPEYFLCVKGPHMEWGNAGYLDFPRYKVKVDWFSEDWLEQLEKDMFNKLQNAILEFDLKIDKPNWSDGEDEFTVFDRIQGIER